MTDGSLSKCAVTVEARVCQVVQILCCDSIVSCDRNANHVLTNFLTHLRSPHLDPLVRELVVKALVACPDVLQWYLPTLQQSCALRPSLGCLSMLGFIRQVLHR
jgi:hypothetical protein